MALSTSLPDTVTWLLPGVALSIVLGAAVAGRLARGLGTSRAVAFTLTVSIGTIVSATLTPIAIVWSVPVSACDLARVGLAPLADLRSLNDTSLNILLFIPLGVSIGLLRRSRIRTAFIVGAAVMPFAIEGLQSALPALGRGCESADVIDNLTGLAIGLALGFGLARFGPTRSGPATADDPSGS